jgi:uncharacterized protein YggU (UPF0235/DUF167 family)
VAKELKARIEVRVHPQARRTGLAGMLGTAYKLDISSPASDGRANEACINLLSELTGLHRSGIRVVKGLTNRSKVFEFDHIDTEDLRRKLNQAL